MKVIKPTPLPETDGSITRASVGTYWSFSRVMTTAPADEVRFSYNPDNLEYLGVLIEPEATNLVLDSETLADQSITLVSGTAYTLSFYGAGTVTTSGASTSVVVGEGQYKRKTLTFTASSTTLTLSVSGVVSYAQVETGSKATSWIPTTATSATRSADVVTGSGLIYTTVTDPNPLWDNASTYADGALARYNGKIYESLQDSNTNKVPGSANPTWWLEVGADNQHAAFDNQINTVTTGTGIITFVIKANNIDAVALVNVVGDTTKLVVTNPSEGIVANRTAGLSGGEVFDWYQYFFYDPLLNRTQVIFTDLPSYSVSYLTIQIKASESSPVSVAFAAFGTLEVIGKTQYGATSGIVDYSAKVSDEFGNFRFVKRNFSKRLSAQVLLSNSELNRTQRFLYNIRATPVVWIGADDPRLEEALVLYGFYKEFSVDIAYPNHSLCSIDVEGLT